MRTFVCWDVQQSPRLGTAWLHIGDPAVIERFTLCFSVHQLCVIETNKVADLDSCFTVVFAGHTHIPGCGDVLPTAAVIQTKA